MNKSNIVIAGAFEGQRINIFPSGTLGIIPCTKFGFIDWSSNYHIINKESVKSYEIITKDTQTSLSSAYKKSLVGGLLFGTAGSIAGAVSANNVSTYAITLHWTRGFDSLIEVDSRIYKAIQKELF